MKTPYLFKIEDWKLNCIIRCDLLKSTVDPPGNWAGSGK